MPADRGPPLILVSPLAASGHQQHVRSGGVRDVIHHEPVYDVGYASGVFDMFHVGHLNILRSAATRCRTLVVGVATDEYIKTLKGRAPVIPFSERIEIVSALGVVHEVIADHAEDKRLAWQERSFDVIFKGDDWRGTTKGERLESSMSELGVAVVYFPYTVHTSSTLLRQHLTRSQAV